MVRCHGRFNKQLLQKRVININANEQILYVSQEHSFPSYLHVSLLLSFRHHLGADWRWSEDCKDEKYLKIVRLFEDRKAAVYSIHQVGQILAKLSYSRYRAYHSSAYKVL